MSFRFDLDSIDRRRLVPGLVLIAIGVLGLLSTLGWLGGLGGLPGAVLFGAGAYVAHLQAKRTGSRRWRLAVYPLAGLAIAAIAPGSLGGFAFLASIGLVFALVYREDPNQWWAVIPAGALFSLAATALVDGMGRAAGGGGPVFLLGLAATFFVLTRLPHHAQPWAVYPAAVLAVLAVVGPLTGGSWAVPVLLIVIGAWMLLRPEDARASLAAAGRTFAQPRPTQPVDGGPATGAAAASATAASAPPSSAPAAGERAAAEPAPSEPAAAVRPAAEPGAGEPAGNDHAR